MSAIDKHTYDLSAVYLTLRPDLCIQRQDFADEWCFVIEDPARSQFFRIGQAEYTFLSLLDGRTSIAQAVAEVATVRKDDAFTETDAAALCSWLIDQYLATTPQTHKAERYIRRAVRDDQQRAQQWLNPVMLKLSLGNPDDLIRRLSHSVGWVFGLIGLCIWLPTVSVGVWCVATGWSRLTAGHDVLAADNWLWLGITGVSLKLIHELAHGLVCRRYGGETREAGVIFLLFVPLPWVDVTSCWRFGSRWQRMYTAAAGMYAELFVAALAAIVFATTDSAVLRFHALNVLTTAGFLTLIFNVNPLMRFDGYYILADAFNLPNLATHGQQDLMWLCRRVFLGIDSPPPIWPEGRGWLIRLYGVSACVWKLMLCVSLTAAATLMFHGAGIAIAVAAVLLWVALPVARFVRYLISGDPIYPPQRLRFLTILTVILLGGGAVLQWVPWIERQRYAAIVDYDPVTSVRSSGPGFVAEIHVRSGQTVDQGELLMTLRNEQLIASVQDVRLSLQKSERDAARYHQAEQLAAWQVERENHRALSRRLDELLEQEERLSIRSPHAGKILSPNLDDLIGQWMPAGAELTLVGDDQSRALHFTAAQQDLLALKAGEGQRVHVHIWGQEQASLVGVIAPVDPRASTRVRFPALTTAGGGPLAVRAAASSASDDAADERWELLEPHFCGTVRLSSQQLDKLGVGQTGYVEVVAHRGSVGAVLRAALRESLQEHQLARH